MVSITDNLWRKVCGKKYQLGIKKSKNYFPRSTSTDNKKISTSLK